MKPLNPILAALLAVHVAAKTTHPAKPAAKAKCESILQDSSKDAWTALDCLVKSELKGSVNSYIALRIREFGHHNNYVELALDTDPTLRDKTNSAIEKWNEKNTGRLAVFYLVLGPSVERPDFANKPALGEKFKANNDNTVDLIKRLNAEGWGTKKQVKNDNDFDKDLAKFLNLAAHFSAQIMEGKIPKAPKLPGKPDTAVAAGSGDKTKEKGSAATAAPPEAGVALRTTGIGFGDDDRYAKGGEVGSVYGPKDPGRRDLSVKIYTVKGKDGKLENMIGVYDMTTPGVGYGVKMFPLSAAGEQKFQFKPDEEVTNPATGKKETLYHRGYILRIDGDNVVIRRDVEGADKGKSLTTSVSKLFEARADQAKSAGQLVTIGSEKYYVLGQGGNTRLSALFFRQSDIDYRTGSSRSLSPAAMVHYMQGGADGVPSAVTWKASLGQMRDGVEADGTAKMSDFHIVFDVRQGKWKVMHGKGDPDPDDPKPESKEPKAGDKPESGGVGDSAPGKSDGGDLTAILAKLRIEHKDWVEDNGTLDDETKKQVRIVKTGNGNFVLVSKDFPKGNLYPPGGTFNPAVSLRGEKKWVVRTNGQDPDQYFSFERLKVMANPNSEEEKGPVGVYNSVNKEMSDVSSAELAHHIFSTRMKMEGKIALSKLEDAVKANSSKGSYRFTGKGGDSPSLNLNWTKADLTCPLYPKERKCTTKAEAARKPAPDAAADTGDSPSKKGDLCAPPDEYTVQKVIDQSGKKDGDAACLFMKNDSKPPESIIRLSYKLKGRATSKDWTIFWTEGLPTDITIKSLGDISVNSENAQVTTVKGNTLKKGLRGLFGTGVATPGTGPTTGNQDNKANCIGVVAFWGMKNLAEAEAACRAGEVD